MNDPDHRRYRAMGPLILALSLLAGVALATPPQPLPPSMLPGDTAPAAAVGDQTAPVIARGGDQYLAVWTDERTAYLAADGEAGSQRDIYAARLDAQGELLDTTPIVVTQRRHDQFDPRVVWNGTNWLVIWTDTEPYGPLYTTFIQGARVSPAGEVLDPEPVLIRDGGTTGGTSGGDHFFAAASDGSDFVLLFQDEYIQGLGTKFRIEARRFTHDLALADTAMLFSPACCYFFYNGGLAYTDGVFMAVFEGYVSGSEYGIFGLRFTAGLNNLDGYPLELVTTSLQGETTYYRTPNVAAGDGEFYLGWQLYIADTSSQIYGARVGTDGVSLDGDGVPVSDPQALSLPLSPGIVWDGSQWILGWDDGDLRFARVDATGAVLDPGGVDAAVSPGPFAAAGGGGVHVVHAEADGASATPYDVFRTTVSGTLVPGDAEAIGLGAPAQLAPHVATGADGSMVAYRSDTSAGSRIMAHPLDAEGEPLQPEPVQLAAGDVDAPRVAFDGTRYLAVWSDGDADNVRGRRLDQQGNVLDVVDLVLLEGDHPDVTGGDGQFFVTASRTGGVFGLRVDGSDGTAVDDPPLELGAGPNTGPVAATLGDYYLATWQADGTADGSEIVVSLVDLTGNVIGPLDVTQDGDGLAPRRPAVAAGDTALIAWEDDRGDDLEVYGRRLASTVSFLDPAAGIALTDAPGDQRAPAVAWDGTQFLHVFTDDRAVVDELDLRTDVYRNWVTDLGQVPELEGSGLFADPVPEIQPAVAAHPLGTIYACSRFTADAPHAAYRIWLRSAGVPTAVGDEVPAATRLLSLYPNPANPAVSIRFRLERSGEARVDVHDLTGARVRTLSSGRLAAGEHVLRWNGRDDEGRELASGTYLFRFRGGGVEESGKVTLVR